MRYLAATVAISPLLLAASPAAQEHLAAPALPGFVVEFEAGNDEQSIREEVPTGETVENWTRMVTTQRFTGAATRVTPVRYLQNITQQLVAACPGASASRPVSSVRSGRTAAQMQADCPLLASTGKPETFIILAIAGSQDLHVKQVAFRRVPTSADVRWGEQFLAGVTLCAANDRSEACRR